MIGVKRMAAHTWTQWFGLAFPKTFADQNKAFCFPLLLPLTALNSHTPNPSPKP